MNIESIQIDFHITFEYQADEYDMGYESESDFINFVLAMAYEDVRDQINDGIQPYANIKIRYKAEDQEDLPLETER